ncbi:MAG: hypothetical protein ACLFU4_06950 [Opitutales bacterium]
MKLTILCFFACIAISPMLLSAQTQRLIATPERIAGVRAAIDADHPHHSAAFESMKARIAQEDRRAAYDKGSAHYVDGWHARESALAALLSDAASDRERYAQMAFESALKASQIDTAPVSGMDENPNQLGLKSAMNGFSIALAYNWMQEDWSEAQREQIRSEIVAGLNDWPNFRHANTSQSHDGSNWVAVTRGAELVMIYAIGEQQERSERVRQLVHHLTNHMQNGFGNLGVGQEGLGYTEYPGVFLLPAALVDQQFAQGEIMQAVAGQAWWKLAMYTHSFQPRAWDSEDRKFLTWGVAERGHDQGWVSLLLSTVPEDQLPYYLWFYDRHMGRDFVGPMDAFERHRAGNVWSLLLYPADVQAEDPTGIFPNMVTDETGFAFFRNRWQDADDIQLMVAADEAHHSNAWDQPDAFSLALLAQNNAFITGAGKDQSEASQTGILVDGTKRGGSNKTTGKMIFAEISPLGGNVRIDGGTTYEALGLSEATRDVAVLFGPPATNLGIISVWDKLSASSGKTYTWQLNTGAPQSETDAISLSQGTESGHKTFTLSGNDGGYLKGWILHPSDARILPGADPLQIETSGQNTEIWVVLLTGKGRAPSADIRGKGLRSGLKIGSAEVFLNPKEDRAVIRLRD